MKYFRRYAVLAPLALLLVLGALVGNSIAQTPDDGRPGDGLPLPPRSASISAENDRPGTQAWRSAELDRGRGQPVDERLSGDQRERGRISAAATWTDTPIRGYPDSPSVNKGSPITFHISTAQSQYDLQFFRMGWYGGAGARLIAAAGRLQGQNQPVPTPDPATGLIEAGWEPSYTLQTGSNWVSGVYLAKMTTTSGAVGYIPFVVRDDGAAADIVYQVPITTWQAYNNWGGKSLYDFSSEGAFPAYKVSFDRPYAIWSGAGMLFDGDYNWLRWLEQKGYNVTYTTSLETHTTAGMMNSRKVFLSPFHDEYWSKPMRDNITAARNAGKHLAWFDSNNVYWQIRWENSSAGAANRVIVCYKDASIDPIGPANPLNTVTWREAPVNQPENALLGVMFESYYNYGTSFPWVVTNATNWVYTGTGVANGTKITGLVGYEYDKVWNNGLTPAGLVTLSSSPVKDFQGVNGVHNASIYQHSSGAWVFSASTNYWSWYVDDNEYQNHGADARVQRMTANILYRMITGQAPPATTPTPTATATPISPDRVVYADALATGWTNGSWGGTVNFANTNPVYSGTRSIRFTATSAWGALGMTASSPVNGSSYSALQFAMRASRRNQTFGVWLTDTNGQATSSARYLVNYGGDPSTTAWKVYTIPLDADNLNAVGKQIKDVIIQEESGAAQTAVYIDDVRFVGQAAPTPTATATPTPMPATATPTPTAPPPTPTPTPTLPPPTPTPTPTLPPPTPTPTPTAVPPTPTPTPTVPPPTPTPTPTVPPTPTTPPYTVYSEGLTNGWLNYSWDSVINYNNTSPVHTGARSIAWRTTAAWGGIYMFQPATVNLAPYTHVRLALRASQTGARIGVRFATPQNTSTGGEALLLAWGGDPVTTGWTVYTIPLSYFNLPSLVIGGIVIQDESGRIQPDVYVDNIEFVNLGGLGASVQRTPTGNFPTATATVFRTPTPTATPPIATPTQRGR